METDKKNTKDAKARGNSFIAKFHVFKGETYLGWDCFTQKRVMVGSSCWADLVLPCEDNENQDIDGICALFTISAEGVLVEDFSAGKQVLVKGQPVEACMLAPLDFVSIGPYSVKIKFSRLADKKNGADFQVAGRVELQKNSSSFEETESIDLKPVAEPLLPIENNEDIHPHFFNPFSQAGSDNTYLDVTPEFTSQNDEGINSPEPNSDLQADEELVSQDPLELLMSDSVPGDGESIEVIMEIIEEIGLGEAFEYSQTPDEEVTGFINCENEPNVDDGDFFRTPVPFLPEDLEAAADDDDIEADFDLKDFLGLETESETTEEPVLEVVKTWKDTVVDIQFLGVREKYFAFHHGRKFRLAEHRKGKFYCYSNDDFMVVSAGGDGCSQSGESVKSQSTLVNKRKKIYRNQLSRDMEIRLSDGSFDYRIRPSVRLRCPEISLPPKEKSTFHKNLLQSGSFHIVFLMVLGFFFSLPTIKQVPLPESRFVKVDMSQFVKQEQPKVVKRQEPVKKEVKKTAPKPIKKIVKIKNPKRKQKVAKRKKAQPKKVVAARKVTPKGGNAKKGNVVKKDVNQTGMLAILGKSGISIQPSVAMAAVTNLDAVATDTNVDRGGYKVSGVVASLGESKVELPSSGGIVDTQGSATVLRSGDQIAALDTAGTGQRQVQSMVTASLDRNVMVKGGISREDVKKVIDQHIDEIQYCYESALINNPSIMGKLVLEWKIKSDGRVGEIPIKSSTLNSSSITRCVKKSIKSWRFPEPEGTESVVVSYPFIFDIVGF